MTNANTAPEIGQPWPEQGGIFIGTRLIDGAAYHVLIPGGAEFDLIDIYSQYLAATIQKCGEVNGFSDWILPDKEDLMLGYINAPGLFDKESLYWISTPDLSEIPMVADFKNGNAFPWRRNEGLRARLVRYVDSAIDDTAIRTSALDEALKALRERADEAAATYHQTKSSYAEGRMDAHDLCERTIIGLIYQAPTNKSVEHVEAIGISGELVEKCAANRHDSTSAARSEKQDDDVRLPPVGIEDYTGRSGDGYYLASSVRLYGRAAILADRQRRGTNGSETELRRAAKALETISAMAGMREYDMESIVDVRNYAARAARVARSCLSGGNKNEDGA